jgi:sporulation protein YlmC with PRC-barrel domain
VAGDPVSWFVIEPGWTVVDADGGEVGRVEEVVGDSNADIFNGLAVSTGLLGGTRYVPAESVKRITDGCIELDLGQREVKQLEKYEEILPPDRDR